MAVIMIEDTSNHDVSELGTMGEINLGEDDSLVMSLDEWKADSDDVKEFVAEIIKS